jgi:hypothetical protein
MAAVGEVLLAFFAMLTYLCALLLCHMYWQEQRARHELMVAEEIRGLSTSLDGDEKNGKLETFKV